jgi:hypothetical protein
MVHVFIRLSISVRSKHLKAWPNVIGCYKLDAMGISNYFQFYLRVPLLHCLQG